MRTGACTRGFTLVEVVVALTLLSLVALGLTTALKTVADSGRRMELVLQEREAHQAVTSLLETAFETASARQIAAAVDGKPPALYFQGRGDSIEWLGVLPARHGFGGLHFLRIEQGQGQGAHNGLQLRYLPFLVRPGYPDWSQAETYELLKDARDVRIQYQGLHEPEWNPEWVQQPVLPGKLMMTVMFGDRAKADLAVSILAAERRPVLNAKTQ